MIKKCQIFTPSQNVKELLNVVEYERNIYGKKVIENACGDGNILKEIVKRYIVDSLLNKKDRKEIKKGLESDIFGVEIDKTHLENCLTNLDIIAKSYDIYNVKWNLINGDFLKLTFKNKFDYIIGNPPYITYRDLDNKTRSYLKNNFISCKLGKFDYCYAFIEASLANLTESGKLAYLIPSSIFKNVFAKELRKLILPNAKKIIDYKTQKLFKNALTSSAILVCDKSILSKKIEYKDVANNTTFIIPKMNLESKWIFSNKKIQNKNQKRFGDYFKAAISLATLLNEAYVIKEFKQDNKYIFNGKFKIEKAIIRKGVSPRSLTYGKRELILFPYTYKNNILKRYTSTEFESKFPEATKYLKFYSDKLSKRKSDKNIEWFEYGRTQALSHLNQPKLLISTIVTNEVKVYELSKRCVPYSGIYITQKKDLSLKKAKEILESNSFYEYIKKIGISASGNSVRITSADVNNYFFE